MGLLLDCGEDIPKDAIEFYPDLIGTIIEGQSKIITVKVKKISNEYTAVWMGFKDANYKTAAVSIAHLPTGNYYQEVVIGFHVPLNSGIPSGNYTLYATMGKGAYNLSGAVTATCETRCVYFEGGMAGPNIEIQCEFLSNNVINYRIQNEYLFPLSLQTKLRDLPPSGAWARVFLEVTMPGGTKLESNYYTYFTDNDFHWETINLEFGGGDYTWDGDMGVKARVKVYDAWPGGTELTSGSFDYAYATKVLAPAVMPTFQQVDIEYDQQIGQNLYDEILEEQGGIGRSDYIDAAFAPALMKMAFHKDANHQALPIQTINLSTPAGREAAANFIKDHHSNANYKYLCAAEKIIDEDGNEVYGVYVNFSTNQGDFPGVFVAYNEHYSVADPYSGAVVEGFRRRILTSTAIHELGHHLGISGHEGHTQGNIFCIMYQGFIPDIEYQKKRSLYVNPHFCETHINTLKGEELLSVSRISHSKDQVLKNSSLNSRSLGNSVSGAGR